MQNEDTGWIQTATGKQFWIKNPRVEDIDILDIAHALANTCRFNGHSRAFYSVAQHCCLMAAAMHAEDASVEVRQWALMHDCDEAYLPDVQRSVKPYLFVRIGTASLNGIGSGKYSAETDNETPVYVSWEKFAHRLTLLVAGRYGLSPGGYALPEIKLADLRMLATERRDLMAKPPAKWEALEGIEPYHELIEAWQPEIAREVFLRYFAGLFPNERTPINAMSVGNKSGRTDWNSKKRTQR